MERSTSGTTHKRQEANRPPLYTEENFAKSCRESLRLRLPHSWPLNGALTVQFSQGGFLIGQWWRARPKLDAAGRLPQFYGMFKIIGGDQRPYGPVSADQLRQWIAEGRADARTLAQAEGSTDWRPLSTFAEFAELFPAEPSPSPSQPPLMTSAPTPMPGASAPAPSPWTPPTPRPDIPTYLPHAIIVTLCCCLPFGIPAIVYAAQVTRKLDAGDVEGAREASRKARMWFWIAFALGAVGLIVQLVMMASSFYDMPGWPRGR